MAAPAMPAPLGGAGPVAPGGPAGVPVVVNVYTLMSKENMASRLGNDVLDVVGMSIYHAGVEVLGTEYAFGMDPSGRPDPNIDGIFTVPPRKAVGDFKEAVVVGHMPPTFGKRDLDAVLAQLRATWRAVTYHILDRNCCHFAKAMVLALNPAFKETFPSYVMRSAKVGSTVVPDMVVSKVTEMVAPPPAIPPHLVNVVDIPFQHPRPPQRQPPGGPAQAPPQAQQQQPKPSKGAGGLFKSVGLAVLSAGKMAASAVGDAVDGLATEADRRGYATKFPQCSAANLQKCFKASVNYCHREYEAEVYIATDAVCITGPPSLSLVIPMSDIDGFCPAAFTEPPAPRLPPSFAPADWAGAERTTAFLIFRRSRPNMATPIFRLRSLTSDMSEAIGSLTGMQGTTLTYDALAVLEKAWARQPR